MKKILLTMVLVALCTYCADAQLLWKVSGPKLNGVSYILGTHHIAPKGMIDSVSGLRDAINSVDCVLGEVDMSNIAGPEVQALTMKALQAPADSTLNVVLTKAEYDSVAVLIKKYFNGMVSIDQLASMKPAAIAGQIALMQNMLASPGFNPADQFDTKVQAVAREAGKETGGLETLEFQLNLLYNDPISEQAKALMKAVRTDDKAIEMTKKLVAAYEEEDIETMEELILDKELGMDALSAQKLIYDRNVNWVKTLQELMPVKKVLVAVGAGHLPGEKGLLNLLKAQGYTVEAVK